LLSRPVCSAPKAPGMSRTPTTPSGMQLRVASPFFAADNQLQLRRRKPDFRQKAKFHDASHFDEMQNFPARA
jgi:hypothetical protein